MLCKYVLTVNGVPYDIPKSSIQNWDEIKFSRKRSGLEGITRTFTSKFQFVGDAYNLLLTEYLSKYLTSSAAIAVYTITDTHNYEELFSCKLDFGSLIYDGNVISINSIDDSVANIIKANKGTQYEYPVKDLKENRHLYYDRINMSSLVNFVLGGGNTNSDGSITYDFSVTLGTGETQHPPIDTYDNEIYYNPGLEFLTDESYDSSAGHIQRYGAVKNISNQKIMITLNVNIELSLDANCSNVKYMYFLIWENFGSSERIAPGKSTHFVFNQNVELKPSQKIMFHFFVSPIDYYEAPATGTYTVKVNELSVKFASRAKPINIDVVKPVVLLNALLKSMNDGNHDITGEIESTNNERLEQCVIVAAESVRGILDAKLYSSYTKFVDWMESVFGFIQKIQGNTVKFVHRDTLFNQGDEKNIASDISDFQYKIDNSRIYSRIRVGYDKQDYESINGRDEFMFNVEYTTGVGITDNVYELISPYRADSYGFEFLAQKRGSGTTDNESDNDVFFVGASATYNEFRLVREGWKLSGVLNPDTLFNVMYWQRAMLQSNAKYLGMSADKLQYASSDGNSDVIVNDIEKLTDDFILDEHLVTCGDVSFTTFDEDVPQSDDIIIKILKDGFVYEGYIKEVSSLVEKNDGVKYDLFVRSITKA